MICTALRAVMICQACGLDKKILVPKNEDFLAGAEGLDSRRELRALVARGRGRPTEVRSVPLILQVHRHKVKEKGTEC